LLLFAASENKDNSNLPKVWHYDHCPYCVRVRVILGLKNIAHELIALPNGDEKAHTDICGKKQVPILRTSDGKIILESLDIVKYFDEFDGKSILKPHNENRPEFEKFSYDSKLTHPRFIELGLPEFNRAVDIEYFTKKKTKDTGDFAENLENTAALKNAQELKLMEFGKSLPTTEQLKSTCGGINGDYWSIDDITVFPKLRSLTCVKHLIWPENMKYYVDNLAKKANINLYYDVAV